MGDGALGVVTRTTTRPRTTRPENKAFVDAFTKANNGMRPNFMAVGGYDGMQLIYEALKTTKGDADGDALLDGDEGPCSWTSPRGPVHDRRRDPRHHPGRLHPQGREGGRRAVERRVPTSPNVKDR